MTEYANPSINRPAEAFKSAGAIAYGGHGSDGFVVNGASPTDLSIQNSNIDETALNTFDETHDGSSYDVTIDPGEAFVFGSWIVKDTSTTVSLTSSTAGQTVYVGWNKDGSDDIIIGLDTAFSNASGDTDERIPLWTFDTDGSGVTNSVDERVIGYAQEATTFTGDISDDQSNTVYDHANERIGTNLVDAVSIDESITPTWTAIHQFDSGLDTRGDIVDDVDVIWDTSAGEIPDSAMGSIDNSTLSNSTVSVAGNNVSLGGSTGVSANDLLDVSSTMESAGQVPIWNATNSEYQNASITGGNALSITEDDSSITINIDTNGIQTDEIDLSITPTWTAEHQFDSGLDSRGDIVDNTDVIWDASAEEIPDSAMGSIDNSTLSNSTVSIAGKSISLGSSITLGLSELDDYQLGTSNPMTDGNGTNRFAFTTNSVDFFDSDGARQAEIDDGGNITINGTLTEGASL